MGGQVGQHLADGRAQRVERRAPAGDPEPAEHPDLAPAPLRPRLARRLVPCSSGEPLSPAVAVTSSVGSAGGGAETSDRLTSSAASSSVTEVGIEVWAVEHELAAIGLVQHPAVSVEVQPPPGSVAAVVVVGDDADQVHVVGQVAGRWPGS